MQTKTLTALTFALTLASFAGAHGTTTFTLSETDKGFSFAGPATLDAGYTTFTLKNTAKAPTTPVFARLKNGATEAQFKAALGKLMATQGEDMTEVLKLADFVGGSAGLAPNGSFEFGTTLDAGKYIVFGFGATEDGKALYDVGQFKTFTVAAKSNGMTAPKADVQATLQDFKVTLPATLKAGKLTWQVTNKGDETHHMMLMRIQDGKTAKDVEAFFKSENPEQAGPPPFEDAGGLETISKGRSAFVNFDLKPGQYVVACFLPSAAKHAPHFALGMMSFVTVK